jgi:hypothetical protein
VVSFRAIRSENTCAFPTPETRWSRTIIWLANQSCLSISFRCASKRDGVREGRIIGRI